MQSDIFLAPRCTLQTAIDGFSLLVSHATQRTGSLRDVVFEQVDSGVAALPQVGCGHICHAGGLLVVVCHHVVHVCVCVGKLLKRPVVCGCDGSG